MDQVAAPRKRASVNGARKRRPLEFPHEVAVLDTELDALRPLRVEALAPGSPQSGLFQWLLQRHHYLGPRNGVGENLKYRQALSAHFRQRLGA